MRTGGWAKCVAAVLAAVGTAATACIDDLTAGGERRVKAVILLCIAGVVALGAFLSTDTGRAVVAQEDAAAGLVKVQTGEGVDAVVRAQDAVAGGPGPGGER